MDFEFSDDQELLRESLRRFLADHAPVTPTVRAALTSETGTDRAIWSRFAALGFVGVLVDESHGGLGATMVDAAVVLEELGAAVHPGAYLSSAIAATSLVNFVGGDADRAALLPGLADGSRVATVAIFEPDRRYAWKRPDTVAAHNDDGSYTLNGTKAFVSDLLDADVVLVLASAPDGLGTFAIDSTASGVMRVPAESVDATRKRGTLTLSNAVACRVGLGDATESVERLLDRLAVATVVDALGAARTALGLVVEYAKERVAFDKPIGSFQAVQHLCADMLRTVELGRSSAYYACWADGHAEPAERRRAATMARAFACDAFPQLGATAIQVFGGIGFTWDHDIHLYYKRLLSASYTLGTADDALTALADLVLP